ncbi:MAG: FtsX-like permease family protein [Clostridiales bacterium]|nr:FtsX-like permease family protein [Clostridiales bacterium]
MKFALNKDTFREIRHSMGRFLSILIIIALGVGFFVGIKATSPSMTHTTNEYFQRQRLMDLRLISTFGFTEEDLAQILALDHVAGIMPSYSADVIVQSESSNQTVKVFALPPSASPYEALNQPRLIEGRMPRDPNECVVEKSPGMNRTQIPIGETLTLAPEVNGSSVSDLLNQTSFEVVGIVDNPMFIAYDRGSTPVGNGTISYFIMIPEAAFAYDSYTEVYVETDLRQRGISAYDSQYAQTINSLAQQLETLGAQQAEMFENTTLRDAKEELQQAEQDYAQGKAEAESKLAQAEQELLDAQQQVSDAEWQLTQGQQQYQAGTSQAEREFAQAERELTQGKVQLDAAELQIAQSQAQLAQAEAEYQQGLRQLQEAEQKLQEAWAQYRLGIAQVEQGQQSIQVARLVVEEVRARYREILLEVERQPAEQQIQTAKRLVSSLEILLEVMEQSEVSASEIAQVQAELQQLSQKIQAAELAQSQGKPIPKIWESGEIQSTIEIVRNALERTDQQLDQAELTLAETQAQLIQGKEELDRQQALFDQEKAAAQPKLDAAAKEIAKGKLQLEAGKKAFQENQATYWDGRAQLAQQKIVYYEQRIKALTELTEGRAQLEEGKQQLEEGRTEYNQAVTDSETQLHDAETQINDAKQQLSQLSELKWYVFDRNDNPGYATFEEDALRIDAVATLFPVFFLAVVLLVCLTTMTRMVEEQRTQIGTLKALGYSSKSIAGKYLLYSSLAGGIGSIVGLAVGFPVFPLVIFTAYRSMYPALPELLYHFPWGYAAGAFAAAVLCTATVSLLSCYQSLRIQPSVLMRPKVPKPGKRILLERIPALWKRLGFTSKVTARNLFRYKIRFCMTLLGVAGCTALIVAGLGLNDSVGVIATKQFMDISHYNATIVLNQDQPMGKHEELKEYLNAQKPLSSHLFTYLESAAVHDESGQAMDVYVFVPESSAAMEPVITLRDRVTGKPVSLRDDGVVVTEKLAKQMSLEVGSQVHFTMNNREYSAPVSGITENYAYHYIYLTPRLYEEVTQTELAFNTVFAILSEGLSQQEKDQLSTGFPTRPDILAVSYNDTMEQQFQQTIQSMKMVVLVLVLTAGALAFVVLYNLTNINIEERVREIATIKVLGFQNKETAAYVLRESILLTLFGIGLGLLLGTVLTTFMIDMIELDIVMFGRGIRWTSYLLAIALTAFFAACVDLAMYWKLKRINMIESLKSNE